jgi:hypothetical protein
MITDYVEGTVSELESRASVSSLEGLQQERRELVKKIAPLAARFKGGNSTSGDTVRKRHRALVMKRIAATQFKDDAKGPSEALLERLANADIEHIDFCDKIEQDFIRYTLLENDIADINEQVRSREECLRCYRAELGLERS